MLYDDFYLQSLAFVALVLLIALMAQSVSFDCNTPPKPLRFVRHSVRGTLRLLWRCVRAIPRTAVLAVLVAGCAVIAAAMVVAVCIVCVIVFPFYVVHQARRSYTKFPN